MKTIQNHRFSPFVGTNFSFASYKQKTLSSNGAEKRKLLETGIVGLAYTMASFIVESGMKYFPNSDFNYYIPTEE